MRFLQKNKAKKIVLVISDLHLSAGAIFNNRPNQLEDFHYDQELVDFLRYYSSDDFKGKDIELIINGDFLDFLHVPYIKVYDDEFFSEKACLMKFDVIINAHKEVFEALNDFVSAKNKKLTYIIGNHDAEMILPSMQEKFISLFQSENQCKVNLVIDSHQDYMPMDKVKIKHGHEYEKAHDFDPSTSVIEGEGGEKYFHPPWGSFYVLRVVNKYKQYRNHINAVRPIRVFLINGLIYDSLFTLRFIFGNVFYFIMVRCIHILMSKNSLKEVINIFKSELELFQNYEEMTKDMLLENDELNVLVVGHTHRPQYRSYYDGSVFINTGTWTRMVNLDFGRPVLDHQLPYAIIEEMDGKETKIQASLMLWKGKNEHPFEEFNF